VAKDLQTWIANSKQIYAQAEAEVAEVVPLLFREFSLANEEGRAALLVRYIRVVCGEQWADACVKLSTN
jgi:hypothetical protein